MSTTLKPGHHENTELGRPGTLCASPEGVILAVNGPASR